MSIIFPFALILILVLVPVIGVVVLHWQVLFGIVLPYAAFFVFLAGFIYRVIKWARLPVPFHIPVTGGQQKSLPWIKNDKIESPTGTAGVIGRLALEVLLFRSLFRNEKVELKKPGKLVFGGNKWLWLGGLAFHWSLLVILIRHSRFFLEPVPSPVLLLQSLDGFLKSPVTAIYLTDATILAGLTYLFLRRIVYPRLRYLSLPADYFAVLLIISIALSGVLMKLVFKVDLEAVKELAIGLASFRPTLPPGIGLAFYIHFFLVSTLLAYFPFSKLMHMPGILFSPTRNLANSSRARRHINPWNSPVKVHTYEEWEDEFRDAIKKTGLPLEKE